MKTKAVAVTKMTVLLKNKLEANAWTTFKTLTKNPMNSWSGIIMFRVERSEDDCYERLTKRVSKTSKAPLTVMMRWTMKSSSKTRFGGSIYHR